MPSLAVAIVAKKDKSTAKSISSPKPSPVIPPDLVSALELLFFVEEQRTGQVAPTPVWFLTEAFASQQQRNFKATPALQHFLHGLLGPAYQGAAALSTYYIPCVMALVLKAVGDGDWRMVGARCEWCLMYWGVRDREVALHCTEAWIGRTMGKWRMRVGNVGNTGNPNIGAVLLEQGADLVQFMQKRGAKLAKHIHFLNKE
jgi:hypothetical protein